MTAGAMMRGVGGAAGCRVSKIVTRYPAAPGVVGHVIVHLWRNMRPPFTLPSGQYQGEGDMQGRMTK
jgi:hypothetical protein